MTSKQPVWRELASLPTGPAERQSLKKQEVLMETREQHFVFRPTLNKQHKAIGHSLRLTKKTP